MVDPQAKITDHTETSDKMSNSDFKKIFTATKDLLESINSIRESRISQHYSAARAQLEEYVKDDPLKTTFTITEGCINEEIAKEIVHRFNECGITATVVNNGWFFNNYVIQVQPALAPEFIHDSKTTEIMENPDIEQLEKEFIELA